MSIFKTVYSDQAYHQTFWKQESLLALRFIGKTPKHQGLLTMKTNDLSLKTFKLFMSSKYLYYTENDLVFISDIKWSLIETFIEESSNTQKYGFRIKQSSTVFCEFYTDNVSELNEWISKLASVAVLQDFDEEFVMLKQQDQFNNSDIFLCQDFHTRKNFSVKKVAKIQLSSLKEIHLLFNEITIMRKLDHKNVRKIFNVYEDEEFVYVVMEYLQYGLVKDWHKSLTENDLVAFARRLFETLAYVHSKKVVFRHLQAECILMNSLDDISDFKLSGFRFSILTHKPCKYSKKSINEIFPKIARKNSLSYKKDIYDAGKILIELILNSSSKQQIMIEKFLNGKEIIYNKKLSKKISLAGLQLLNSLLSFEPFNRPTALEVIENEWLHIKGLRLAHS